jgi:hypothetical protein
MLGRVLNLMRLILMILSSYVTVGTNVYNLV